MSCGNCARLGRTPTSSTIEEMDFIESFGVHGKLTMRILPRKTAKRRGAWPEPQHGAPVNPGRCASRARHLRRCMLAGAAATGLHDDMTPPWTAAAPRRTHEVDARPGSCGFHEAMALAISLAELSKLSAVAWPAVRIAPMQSAT